MPEPDRGEPAPPAYPLADGPLLDFLAGPVGGLIAALDGDGRVVRASEALERRLPPSAVAGPLERVLSPASGRRWARRWPQIPPGGRPRIVLLEFRGEGPGVAYRCLVQRTADGTGWLLGLPAADAEALGATRELAHELAGLHRHLRRSRAMAKQVARARREALTDPLTGLANRRQGRRWFREAIGQDDRGDGPLCCAIVDIDYFKAINDTFGHPVGDRVLQVAARTLVEQLRPLDRLFRYGGEEFVVLFPETVLADASALADRLRRALAGSPDPPARRSAQRQLRRRPATPRRIGRLAPEAGRRRPRPRQAERPGPGRGRPLIRVPPSAIRPPQSAIRPSTPPSGPSARIGGAPSRARSSGSMASAQIR